MENDNLFVVDTGDSYAFKVEEKLTKLKAGIYYPSIDSNGRKHLMKRSGNTHDELDDIESGPLKVRRSHSSTEPKNGRNTMQAELQAVRDNISESLSIQERLRKESEDREFGFVDSSFFPLFKYHEGLENIHEQLTWFLENKEWYINHEIDYKRGVLAFSDPGTGKTRYMEYFSKYMVKKYDGIVVRIENNEHLHAFVHMIDSFTKYLKDRKKLVIVEELSDLLEHRDNRTLLLNLLDNPVFGHDIIFFLTTNFPERIQENIIDRPSRIDILEPINVDGYTDDFVQEWYKHLFDKDFPEEELKKSWFLEAKGLLNIAYWKELFVFAYMRQLSFEDAFKEIQKRRNLVRSNFKSKEIDDDSYIL